MYIVADIGGTKMRIAGSDDLVTIREQVIIDSPKEYAHGIARFIDEARRIAGGAGIDAVAIGFTGVILQESGTSFDSNLPDWDDKFLRNELEVALVAPVHIENDTALVGLGEAVYGAGKGAHIMAYMTVSTGVNGVRIVDGKIDPTTFGFEIGEQFVTVDGNPCRLGEVISGAAISKKYGKPPRDLGKETPVWEELAGICAYGVSNSISHWSPDRFVLGGSMFNEVGIPVPSVAANVRKLNEKYPKIPDIVHSSLGDVGGLWGGLALLNQVNQES